MQSNHAGRKGLIVASLAIYLGFLHIPEVLAQRNAVDLDAIKKIVAELSSDEYQGRAVGTQENKDARDRLVEELESLGVAPAGTLEGGFLQPWEIGGRKGANVIGVLYPVGRHGQEAPTVLLSAHYDGPTQNKSLCFGNDVPEGSGISNVCNGAADNMVGVGAILGLVKIIRGTIQTPVAIAFWDGEEDLKTRNTLLGGLVDLGLLGSSWFAKYPSFPTHALRLHINLESVGFDAYEGLEHHIFVLGAHSGGDALEDDILQAMDDQNYGLEPQFLHYATAQKNTDIGPFVPLGWKVPLVCFSNGPVGTYHSRADDYNHVNWEKVNAVAEATRDLTVKVANEEPRYTFDDNLPYMRVLGNVFYRIPYETLYTLLEFIELSKAAVNTKYEKTHEELETGRKTLQWHVDRGRWFWNAFGWPLAGLYLMEGNSIMRTSMNHNLRLLEQQSE